MLRTIAVCCLWLAALSFLLGVFGPSYAAAPTFGDPLVDAIFLTVRPDLALPRKYSIVGTIAVLYGKNKTGLAVVILLFSIVVPILKLATMFGLVYAGAKVRPRHRKPQKSLAEWFLYLIGTWSMVEVYVIALCVVACSGVPGARLFIQWGIWFFTLSVFCALSFSSCRLLQGRWDARAHSTIRTDPAVPTTTKE